VATKNLIKQSGLWTNVNPQGSYPEGAMLEASNVVIDKDDIVVLDSEFTGALNELSSIKKEPIKERFDAVETIEKDALEILKNTLNKYGLRKNLNINDFGYSLVERELVENLIKSESAKNYWYQQFIKEQKTIKQLFEELNPLERAELIQGYCDECGLNTTCYCKSDE